MQSRLTKHSAILLAAAAGIIGCADNSPTSPHANASIAMSKANGPRAELDAAAAGRQTRGIEDEILRLENVIPGLGGMFVNAQGNVTLFVPRASNRTSILHILSAAASTLRVSPGMKSQLVSSSQIQFLDADFAFSQLVVWQRAITSQELKGSGIFAVDADESRNRVRILVGDAASVIPAQRLALAAGVPAEAVIVNVESAPEAAAPGLRGTWRPTGGGVQISNPNGGRCSLGFNVETGDQTQGFITAAHCAPGAVGSGGTGDMYQPIVGSGYDMGWIRFNPLFNDGDPSDCGGYTLCTIADAMYVQYYDGGQAAKRVPFTQSTGFNNNGGSIIVTGWWNTPLAPVYPMMGESADKMGRTTGWTRGTVVSTCAPVVIGSSYVVTCASEIDNARVGTGDSGAPVFLPPPSGQFQPLYPLGVLFAGANMTQFDPSDGTSYCNAACKFWYSRWDQIQTHFQSPLYPYNYP